METKAVKKLLLAVQKSEREHLRLDGIGGTGKFVSREGEGQMKEDNRVLGLVGTS